MVFQLFSNFVYTTSGVIHSPCGRIVLLRTFAELCPTGCYFSRLDIFCTLINEPLFLLFRNDNLHIEQRTISAFLMAAYAVLLLDWDPDKTNRNLLASMPARLAFFRDYHGDSDYKLNILDCLRGLFTGCKVNKWFTLYSSTKFPQATSAYLDMNWIVPNQFLAFKDPTTNREKEMCHISKPVIKELKRCGINVIIRLNGNDHAANMDYYGFSYNANDFRQEKFHHYEIPFKDVSIPNIAQANQFVSLCEKYGEKIAVALSCWVRKNSDNDRLSSD